VDHTWPGPNSTPRFENFGGVAGATNLQFDVPWNPSAHINETLLVTHYFQAESSVGARDGIVRVWVNGVLLMDKTNIHTGVNGVDRFQFPSVFMAPAINQTEYFWDIVAWTPAQ
jgi:hypothetical protein